MKKEIRIIVNNATLSDKNFQKAIDELQTKGFFKDGKFVYEEQQEKEILELLKQFPGCFKIEK